MSNKKHLCRHRNKRNSSKILRISCSINTNFHRHLWNHQNTLQNQSSNNSSNLRIHSAKLKHWYLSRKRTSTKVKTTHCLINSSISLMQYQHKRPVISCLMTLRRVCKDYKLTRSKMLQLKCKKKLSNSKISCTVILHSWLKRLLPNLMKAGWTTTLGMSIASTIELI